METEKLLELLADGKIHSGEEIGSALSVSRAAVWKRLQKLEELGIQVESIKGKGYQIVEGLDLLDEQKIRTALMGIIENLLLVWSIDSTNKYILDRCNSGEGHRSLCIAETQSEGRGRRGRVWHSPFACNLYFSIGWQFSGGAKCLEGLSLAVGVCIARVLKKAGLIDVGLKWPNDVVVQGKKIAGILLEMTGDASGQCQVVVGIGLNVKMQKLADKIQIDQPWTDVSSHSINEPNRTNLLLAAVLEVESMLQDYEVRGFEYYKEEWEILDICRNKQIKLSTPAMEVLGYGKGVTSGGEIIIATDDGEHIYNGGEVSLRIV